MAQFKGWHERERQHAVKMDGKQITIENIERAARTFIDENNIPHTEADVGQDLRLICELCSGEVDIHDCVRLVDGVYHWRCGELIVDEILERELEKPGSFNASTMTQVYALNRTFRRERWLRHLHAVVGLLFGRRDVGR
jgi:hypothetical protein